MSSQEEEETMKVKQKQPVLRENVNPESIVQPEEGPEIKTLPLVFSVIVQHTPANGADHDYDEITWHTIDEIGLWHLKRLQFPMECIPLLFKQILSNYAFQNRDILQD